VSRRRASAADEDQPGSRIDVTVPPVRCRPSRMVMAAGGLGGLPRLRPQSSMGMTQEEARELSRQALRRYWAELTPEQRADRTRRSVETRRRNAELLREQHRLEAERIARAAAARQRRRERAGLAQSPEPAVVRGVPGSGDVVYQWLAVERAYLVRGRRRFWRYVDDSGGPRACWPWHGNRRFDTGYGQTSWRGQPCPSHRVAWMLATGLELPYELVVDHLCCCTWCQNPDHLEPVTAAENVRRVHRRPPEATRVRTSFEEPFGDRWYPAGRRLYDGDGNRIAAP
jgi:hypothetical protein